MISEKQAIDSQGSIQYLKGVGPVRAETFEKLGVKKNIDLLEYFPRDWVFPPKVQKINTLMPKHQVTVAGLIESIDYYTNRRPSRLEVYIADDTGIFRLIWFNGGYLMKQLQVGMCLIAWGKTKLYKHNLHLANPEFRIVDELPEADADELGGAVYPATAELSSRQISRIIKPAVEGLLECVEEFFDTDYEKKRNLIPRKKAYQQIHLAKNDQQAAEAKRRLKYDEFFLMQSALALRRYRMQHFSASQRMQTSDKIDSKIRRRFPFLLTEDQNNVIEEIVADMAMAKPMNRLLQGDVGSGKTVVALYAALLAVANKTQVAIMAPTEILANQHFISMERYLRGSRVRRAVITGSMNAKERAKVHEEIKNGQINIVVGTVALLNKDMQFQKLGLVVIDEQHKFGVGQRAMLRKQHCPHCLVMTATPIPRTLAMTAFGDLDISVIKHRPPGRGKVITRFVNPENRQAAYEFIAERLRAGKQAYFVYPRIANLEDNDQIKAAVDEYEKLSKVHFSQFNVALLHGRMPSDKKQQTMNDFRKGKISLLVSTVVIEVGVDVPNATIMVIETADRFGLAQLHQLRGRIGRGQSNSYCLLFSDTDNDIAVERLGVMMRSNDGFAIAEHDLRLRGPGEMFSTRQHGLPDLKIANIIDDFDLLQMTRRDAFEVINDDPALQKAEHKNISKALIEKFKGKINLVDIG